MSLLEVKDLNISINRKNKKNIPIVKDVNFKLEPGQVLGIVGESGSGKTLTAMSILRLLDSALSVHGEIYFQGRDLLLYDSKLMRQIRGNQIGVIFQDPMNAFNPLQTIHTHFKHVLKQGNQKADMDTMLFWLERVGLPPERYLLRKYPFELSGGMLQKLMIAVVLSRNPLLLIADEPTASLDTITRANIIKLLQKQKADDLAIILISHDTTVIVPIADYLAVMYSGRIIEYGNANIIMNNPAHPYTKALIESVPSLNCTSRITELQGQPQSPLHNSIGCPFIKRCAYYTPMCMKKNLQLQKVHDNHYTTCREALVYAAPNQRYS